MSNAVFAASIDVLDSGLETLNPDSDAIDPSLYQLPKCKFCNNCSCKCVSVKALEELHERLQIFPEKYWLEIRLRDWWPGESFAFVYGLIDQTWMFFFSMQTVGDKIHFFYDDFDHPFAKYSAKRFDRLRDKVLQLVVKERIKLFPTKPSQKSLDAWIAAEEKENPRKKFTSDLLKELVPYGTA